MSASSNHHYIRCVVPLEHTEKEYTKTQMVAYKLRTVPTDVDSTTFEYKAVVFEKGKPQEYLDFHHKMERVFVGLNLTSKPIEKFAIAANLLQGEALRAFEAYVSTNAHTDAKKTDRTFKSAMEAVAKTCFPDKAVWAQKRWLNRFCKKPLGMSTRDFMNRLAQINNDLAYYPGYSTSQRYQTAELLDVAEWAVPHKWRLEMIKQDFDACAGDIPKFIAFCERMEKVELALSLIHI